MGEAYPKGRQLAAENKPRKNRCLLQTAEPVSDDCVRCEAAPRPQLRLMSFATELRLLPKCRVKAAYGRH